MARLNKVQIYAIQWLNSQNKNPADIAQELELKTDQVIKTLEKFNSNSSNNSIKTNTIAVNKPKNLMITETAKKKNNNVSIMTKEASEYHDSVRNKNTSNPKTDKFIFRTKNS